MNFFEEFFAFLWLLSTISFVRWVGLGTILLIFGISLLWLNKLNGKTMVKLIGGIILTVAGALAIIRAAMSWILPFIS